MSAIVKTVSKTFRKIVPKPIKDIANKVWNNKVARMAILAAATWYTTGVASAYFAAPQAGIGAAMQSSGTAMWQTATTGQFVSGANVATGASATAGSQASMLAAQTAEFGSAGTAATNAALATPAAAEAGAGTMSALTANAGSEGLVASQMGSAAVPAASTGMSTAQLAATMIGGQAVIGAMGAKSAQQQRDFEENVRQSRGTYGFNYEGQPSGLVRDSMALEAPQAQNVDTQGAQRVRQVKKQDLPELRRQGLINQNRRT